jgi:hypothetical protein
MKGNRKFYIVAAALVFAFVLALLGKLTADFAMVASICVGAFAAANAFEHKFGNGQSPPPAAGTP